MPVTCGTATDVPVIAVYPAAPIYVDHTSTPGAAMSTLLLPKLLLALRQIAASMLDHTMHAALSIFCSSSNMK